MFFVWWSQIFFLVRLENVWVWTVGHVKCSLQHVRVVFCNLTTSSQKSNVGSNWLVNLTFTGPCIANIFADYNQQVSTFHNLFISVRCSTCFRQFFHPSSGAQNCTYSVRYCIGLTITWRCMCSFELLIMDRKTVWNI